MTCTSRVLPGGIAMSIQDLKLKPKIITNSTVGINVQMNSSVRLPWFGLVFWSGLRRLYLNANQIITPIIGKKNNADRYRIK